VEDDELLVEQVREHDDGIALRAVAAQADNTCEGVAVDPTLVSDGACFAGGALVDGVLEKLPPAFQLSSKEPQGQA
jgi:hypothetical protein